MADDADDKLEKWIDRACDDGWDPAADCWGPAEFDDLPTGPPLSADELKDARSDLARWRTPADFRLAVHKLHKRCPSREFIHPQPKFLLDALTLAEFVVRHQSVDQVRLAESSEQWPDGYVKIGSKDEYVEVTSADMPGRKIWEEYQFEGKLEYDPVDNWVARAEAIPGALEKAIADKEAKRYGSKAWLVVYLNLNDAGIRQLETERIIAEIKQRHVGGFAQLFVFWKDKLL